MGVSSALVMAALVASCVASLRPGLRVRPGHRIGNGLGHGNSLGSGHGYGSGYGSGHSNSHGSGHGYGSRYGSGYGSGHGNSHGSGQGHGSGHGNSHGSGHGSVLRSFSCEYWCRASPTRFYCCDDLLSRPTPPPTHPGECPRVRPSCPRTHSQFAAPQPCHEDRRCSRVDKCCYDVCLDQRVCKPSQPFI